MNMVESRLITVEPLEEIENFHKKSQGGKASSTRLLMFKQFSNLICKWCFRFESYEKTDLHSDNDPYSDEWTKQLPPIHKKRGLLIITTQACQALFRPAFMTGDD